MKKNVVNWFEIPVTDMERAKNFYKSLLDVTLEDMPEGMPGMQLSSFPMAPGGEYATGALAKSENHVPSTSGTTVFFACADINDQLSRVEGLGGKVVLPRTSIGEHGFIAQVIDPEGNKIALHSQK